MEYPVGTYFFYNANTPGNGEFIQAVKFLEHGGKEYRIQVSNIFPKNPPELTTPDGMAYDIFYETPEEIKKMLATRIQSDFRFFTPAVRQYHHLEGLDENDLISNELESPNMKRRRQGQLLASAQIFDKNAPNMSATQGPLNDILKMAGLTTKGGRKRKTRKHKRKLLKRRKTRRS